MDGLRRRAIARMTEVAEEDLRVAQMCLHSSPPALRAAAFHAQQAAEKYLKAWLIALGDDDPPATHNLIELADIIISMGGPSLPRRPLRFLTRFAVAPRYGMGTVSGKDAQRAVQYAADIVDAARQAISKLSKEG